MKPWSITDEGRAAYAELPDPEAFYRRAVKLYRDWKAAQPDADSSNPEASGIGDGLDTDAQAKAVSITFEEAEEHAWAEIAAYPSFCLWRETERCDQARDPPVRGLHGSNSLPPLAWTQWGRHSY